jgi:hypothetical protein
MNAFGSPYIVRPHTKVRLRAAAYKSTFACGRTQKYVCVRPRTMCIVRPHNVRGRSRRFGSEPSDVSERIAR